MLPFIFSSSTTSTCLFYFLSPHSSFNPSTTVNPPPHTHPLPPPRLGQQTSTQTSPISVTTGRRSFEVALSSSNKQSVIPTVRLTVPPAPPATRHPEHLPSSDANSCFPTSWKLQNRRQAQPHNHHVFTVLTSMLTKTVSVITRYIWRHIRFRWH